MKVYVIIYMYYIHELKLWMEMIYCKKKYNNEVTEGQYMVRQKCWMVNKEEKKNTGIRRTKKSEE